MADFPEEMIVFLRPDLYAAAEAQGVDMRYYRRVEPLQENGAVLRNLVESGWTPFDYETGKFIWNPPGTADANGVPVASED
jgi:hypothetical protein